MKASTFIESYVKTKVASTRIGAIQNAAIFPRLKSEQQTVLFAYKWRFLQTNDTVTAASGEAAFPEKFGQIIGIKDVAEDAFMDMVDVDDFVDEESTANVFAIDWLNKKLLFKKDGDFRVYFHMTNPKEVTAESEILLGLDADQFELLYDALADGVVSRLYAFYQKYEEAGYWNAEKKRKLKKLFAITRKAA